MAQSPFFSASRATTDGRRVQGTDAACPESECSGESAAFVHPTRAQTIHKNASVPAVRRASGAGAEVSRCCPSCLAAAASGREPARPVCQRLRRQKRGLPQGARWGDTGATVARGASHGCGTRAAPIRHAACPTCRARVVRGFDFASDSRTVFWVDRPRCFSCRPQ